MILGYDGALAASRRPAWDELLTPPRRRAGRVPGGNRPGHHRRRAAPVHRRGPHLDPTPGAPPVVLADWDGTAVVATSDGTVAVSTDTGLTWQLRGRTPPPQAITATADADAAGAGGHRR